MSWLAPLTKAGFRSDEDAPEKLVCDAETGTRWEVEALGEGDDITLCCRISHPDFEDAQTLHIELAGLSTKVRRQIAKGIALMADVLDTTNYDRLVHQWLFGSGLTVAYRDGWLKAGRRKEDLPKTKLARRKAFVAACKEAGFEDTKAYDAMFDAGLTVSPEARAEVGVRGGRLVLDYYVHRDFLELVRETDDARVGLRVFRPTDLGAAITLLARLRAKSDARTLADVARKLVALAPIVGLDTEDGWQMLSVPPPPPKALAKKEPAAKKAAQPKKRR